MAVIRPFAGVRYSSAAGDLASLVCAPYDIITPAAQRHYYARSPHNAVRLELGYENPGDSPQDNRHTRAAAIYHGWLADRILQADPGPGFYVYDEEFDYPIGQTTRRRSLIAAVRLAPWDDGSVLPHEHTFPKAKADRLDLLRATYTQFSPLLALYDDPGGVTALLNELSADLPDAELSLAPGQVAAAAATHRLWRVASPRLLSRLRDAFADQPLFIADGHHRYETALTFRDEQRRAGLPPDSPADYVMMALVATRDPGVIVLPTHRMVRGLGHVDGHAILARLSEHFAVETLPFAPERVISRPPNALPTTSAVQFQVLGLEPGKMVYLTLRSPDSLDDLLADVPASLRLVDTVVLQRLILGPILGLSGQEGASGERVAFTRDPEEAAEAYRSGAVQLVFFLQPTSIAQLRDVSQAGVRMPQKTTYFWPKPVTGLVMYDQGRA